MIKKITTLSILFILAMVNLAQAATQTINVVLTNASPTFTRPNVSGNPPGSLSAQTGCYYSVFAFTAPVAGSYTFTSFNPIPTTVDPFGVLYQNSFVPSSPLTNFLRSNDDYSADPTNKNYGFSRTLVAGVTYYLVSTQFYGASVGTYQVNITGPFLTPLPVEMTSFTANLVDNKVELDWTTATEHNCAGFDVERSANGSNFTKLSRVNSKSVAGISLESLDYSFIDQNPLAVNYYRLAQVDLDGKTTYSAIQKVIKSNSSLEVSAFPNPMGNTLNVSIQTSKASRIDMNLTNIVGSRMIHQSMNTAVGMNHQQLDVASLPKGVYLLNVYVNDKHSETLRVIKN